MTRKREDRTVEKFTTLTGVAAPLNMINVDTDAIIPKKYLKTIKRTGLGTALFGCNPLHHIEEVQVLADYDT